MYEPKKFFFFLYNRIIFSSLSLLPLHALHKKTLNGYQKSHIISCHILFFSIYLGATLSEMPLPLLGNLKVNKLETQHCLRKRKNKCTLHSRKWLQQASVGHVVMWTVFRKHQKRILFQVECSLLLILAALFEFLAIVIINAFPLNFYPLYLIYILFSLKYTFTINS